jgi:hypothetical protein
MKEIKKKKDWKSKKKSKIKFKNEIINLLNKNTLLIKQMHKKKIKIHEERMKMFEKLIDKL